MKKKEAGPSTHRPTRTSAHAEEEDKEEGSEESDPEQSSENIETDFEEDPFKEHPAQPEMWDMYDAIRERRTKARQEVLADPKSPRRSRQ